MFEMISQITVMAEPDSTPPASSPGASRTSSHPITLVAGVTIIAGARKGQMSQNALTITNMQLGCMGIAGAGLFYAFADSIATFIFEG